MRAALRIAAAEARDHQRGLQAAERRLAELGRSARARGRFWRSGDGRWRRCRVPCKPSSAARRKRLSVALTRPSTWPAPAPFWMARRHASRRPPLICANNWRRSPKPPPRSVSSGLIWRWRSPPLSVSAASLTDYWLKRPGCWPPSMPPTRLGGRGWRRWPARPAICAGCWNNCPSIAGPKGAPPTVWRRWPCQSRRREARPPGASLPTAPGGLFTQSILARKGQLPAPVIGRVVQGFGRRDGRGQITKGVAIRSRAGAPVVAPFDGRVLYAGPFRSYGLILIIDHGQGYHTLLAGLGRLHMAVGQTVLAGEPIGVMARDKELSADRLDLYLELRHDGTPIDPLPWLASG